jgi:TM2 domain-containing membrane protein YozV
MPSAESVKTDAPRRVVVSLAAIFLGSLGVHKFLLGYTNTGLKMLLVTLLTCVGGVVMAVVGIIEGIGYLRRSDEAFQQTYVANRREWF